MRFDATAKHNFQAFFQGSAIFGGLKTVST